MLAARLIQHKINATLKNQGHCNVMLTGGRSAERLYIAWSGLAALLKMTKVHFYFGDERCVLPVHPESNYGMAMRTLFRCGVPTDCSVSRMEADDPNCESAALRYGAALPKAIDVMLLGVGADGHIASLFPKSDALHETDRLVVSIIGHKPPYQRLTITPPVIARAKSVFVLANGTAKVAVLSKALQDPDDIDALPARLALNATWLLDSTFPENNIQ